MSAFWRIFFSRIAESYFRILITKHSKVYIIDFSEFWTCVFIWNLCKLDLILHKYFQMKVYLLTLLDKYATKHAFSTRFLSIWLGSAFRMSKHIFILETAIIHTNTFRCIISSWKPMSTFCKRFVVSRNVNFCYFAVGFFLFTKISHHYLFHYKWCIVQTERKRYIHRVPRKMCCKV